LRFRPRLEALEDRCVPSAGALDTSFGSGGAVTTPIGSQALAYAVTVYPNAGTVNDSKIVAAGFDSIGFALARYNTNGSLDTSFGSGGTVSTAIKNSASEAFAVALQPDGKVLAAGFVQWTRFASSLDFALERYTTSGSLDPTFGSGGIVTTNFTGKGTNTSADFAFAIALQSDGKILVAGTTTGADGPYLPQDNDIALARYNSNGSLDTTFGKGGLVITSYTAIPGSLGWTGVSSVAVEPNGTIVVVGEPRFTIEHSPTGLPIGGHPFAIRYTPSGAVDTTFGGKGIVVLSQVPSGYDAGATPDRDVSGAIQAWDGSIVVATNDTTTGYTDLARLNTDGSLGATFGTAGVAYESAGLPTESLALESDGKIVTGSGQGVARYLSNGAPDTTFGTNGISSPVPAPWSQGPRSVAIQPDGRIVLAGSGGQAGTDVLQLVRYLGDSPTICSFTANPNPVTAGSSLTLTASNLVDLTAGATITQVAFYVDTNGDGKLDSGDTLLGYGTQTSPAVWAFTFTVNLASGSYTLLAQAEDSYGVFGDPVAVILTVN
jgi:uncharacterized delta-60 repeat protein